MWTRDTVRRSCIHGYTGYIERHWIATGVFANLAKDHRVIALDCRGHGKSGKPTDPKAYGAEMAQDIVRLLDHLKIRRAHVVGFSMGAMIAGPLLITNADRLLTVTFVGHHPVRKWTTVDEQQAEVSARELEGDLGAGAAAADHEDVEPLHHEPSRNRVNTRA